MIKSSLSLLIILAMIVGCAKKRDDNSVTKQEIQNLVDNGEYEKASSRLSDIGEKLLAFDGAKYLSEVNEVFNQALELNPSNTKANFYSAFVTIAMSAEGLTDRTSEISSSDGVKGREVIIDEVLDSSFPGLFNFVNADSSTKTELNKVEEFREYARDELSNAYAEAAIKISKLDTKEASKIIRSAMFKNVIGKKIEKNYCWFDTDGWYCQVRRTQQPSSKDLNKVVDSIDIKVFEGAFKSISIGLKLTSLFKGIDAERFDKKLNKLRVTRIRQNTKPTEEDYTNLLNKFTDLLVVDPEVNISEAASDIEVIAKDALDLDVIRNEVCPRYLREKNIVKEICLTQKTLKLLSDTIELLYGPKDVKVGRDQDGASVRMLVNLTPVISGSVVDLKDALPIEFNANGQATKLKDPTLNGVFPNGDLLEKAVKILDKN